MIRISFSLIGDSGFCFSTLWYLSIIPADEKSKTLGFRERSDRSGELEMSLDRERKREGDRETLSKP